MNRPRTSLRPSVESLEAVTLLSGLAASVPIVAALVATTTTPIPPVPAPRELALNGNLHGTYTSHNRPDIGTTYDLFGRGHVTHLGRTSVTGNLHSVGFIMHGHATGQLFLSDARGTLTLTLTGPQQEGFANLPDRFDYTITNGSGAFLHVKDSGTVVLVRDPATPKPGATSPLVGHGKFTLILVSDTGNRIGGGKVM